MLFKAGRHWAVCAIKVTGMGFLTKKVFQPIRSSTMPVWETRAEGDFCPKARPNVTLGLKAGGLSLSRVCSERVYKRESERLSPNMRLPRPLGSAAGRKRVGRKRPFGPAWPAGRTIRPSMQTRRALRGTEKFLRAVVASGFPKCAKGRQNFALRVQSGVGAVAGPPKRLLKEGRNRVVSLPQGGDAGAVADLFQLASAVGVKLLVSEGLWPSRWPPSEVWLRTESWQ